MSIKKLSEDNLKEPNFIGSWSIEENICIGLIDYFNKNNDINNPLKNIKIPEYDKIPDYSDVDENTNMNKFINNKFFRTESDMIFDKEARQFYTMPNNNLPNKQYEFANWLYGTNDNCKSTSIYAHRLGHSLENKNCDTGLNVSVPTNEGKL